MEHFKAGIFFGVGNKEVGAYGLTPLAHHSEFIKQQSEVFMKKIFLVIISLVFLGCTYEGNTLSDYLSDPRSIIRDPHFGEYQESRDELERQYLKKEISYAEYVEKMDELDKQYTKEVEQRNEILSQ